MEKIDALHDSIDYISINVKLPCESGCTTDGHRAGYQLFIDPSTYRIKAIRYFIAYGAFLDAMEVPRGSSSLDP